MAWVEEHRGAISRALRALGEALSATGARRETQGVHVCLTFWQYAVVRDVAERMCASDHRDAPTATALGVADFVDHYAAALPPHVQSELLGFLTYVEHLAPRAAGERRAFTKLDATAQDHVLASLETSALGLVRGGFAGLKAVVMMGYYRHASTWPLLDYDGPLVREAP